MCARRYLHARFDRLDCASLIETVTWYLRRQSLTTCSLFFEKDDVLVVSRVSQASQFFMRYSWSNIYEIDDKNLVSMRLTIRSSKDMLIDARKSEECWVENSSNNTIENLSKCFRNHALMQRLQIRTFWS